jgi:hypothetical protein
VCGSMNVRLVVPHRLVLFVIAAVDEVVVVGPPHLVVGGGDDLARDVVGDRAPQGDVQMRCAAFLRFRVATLELLAKELF